MVPPSKDGESIKGGVYDSDLMDTLEGLGIVIEQSVPHPLGLSWEKCSAYTSWHAYCNHGGNSALIMQFI